jgi:hypothetical protein
MMHACNKLQPATCSMRRSWTRWMIARKTRTMEMDGLSKMKKEIKNQHGVVVNAVHRDSLYSCVICGTLQYSIRINRERFSYLLCIEKRSSRAVAKTRSVSICWYMPLPTYVVPEMRCRHGLAKAPFSVEQHSSAST